MVQRNAFSCYEQKLVALDQHPAQHYQRPLQTPIYLNAMAPPENASLAAYCNAIWRRRFTVVTVIAVLTTIAAIAAFKMRPVYKAVARVELNAEIPQIQSLQGMYQQMPTNQDFLRTQIQLLETDNLAWRTVEQLGLGQNTEFLAESSKEVNWRSDSQRKMGLIRKFKSALSAELVPGSRVIEVGFESTDPDLASNVANALVSNYIDFNFRQQYDSTRAVSGRMEQQLDELKANVEKSQQALVDYERANAIFSVSDKQNVVEQRLSELSTDFTAAQADRMQKQAVYEQVRSKELDVKALAHDEVLQKLTEQLSSLRNQYADALAQYGPTFPKVVRIEKQIEQAEITIQGERGRLLDRMRGEYEAAKKREALLGAAVTQQKQQASALNQLLVQHNLLKGEFDSNQQLYQRLMQQLKDATVAAGLRATNIHVVDTALAPAQPVRPKKLLYIGIGLMLGCIFGVVLALLQEAADTSVKAPEELEVLIATPMLAAIPAKDSLKLQRGPTSNVGTRNGVVALTVAHEPDSPLAEAYRTLRTATLLSTTPNSPKAILITSAKVGEGKTTTAMNLAISLAQSSGPVVMIDADLRRPGLTCLHGLDTSRGLSSVLSGHDVIESALQQFTEVPGLFILPSGPVVSQPTEMLSSETMANLMDVLRKKFKHIIVDCAPIMAVTDPTILATMVDGVILVVESGSTPKKIISRARKVLEAAGARVMGVVLNKYDVKSDGYECYYSAYYSAREV